MDFVALAVAFGSILLVELPDKTLVATLVLSTRYKHLPVFVGVSLAFLVQCAIAVTAGSLLHLLPNSVVAYVVAALFFIGALVLLREVRGKEDEEDLTSAATTSPLKMGAISFTVLFAAEWGDASQLATAALTARYQAPLSVGIGAWLALVIVAALAILLGKVIRRKIPLKKIQLVATVVFFVLGFIALYEAITG
ncbi:MAG: TMEM165/GDT1 family protein [Antricoccus sp.]